MDIDKEKTTLIKLIHTSVILNLVTLLVFIDFDGFDVFISF